MIEEARRLDAAGIALSAEEPWCVSDTLDYVGQRRFAIVTMKGVGSLSVVIRSLHVHPRGKDRALYHLLAIAVTTESRTDWISYRVAQGGDWGEGR